MTAKTSVKKQEQAVRPPPPREDAILPLLGDEETVAFNVEEAPPPNDAELAKIRRLAELQIDLMARIARGNAVLARLNAYLSDVTDRQLPLAMKEVSLRRFELLDGTEIVMEDFVVAAIKKENRPQAYDWLKDNDHGDLVKRTVIVTFGKGEEAWAKKFIADMARRKKPLKAEIKEDVHFQTLNAFVREEFAALRTKGINPLTVLPQALLGIYEGSKAAAKLSEVAVRRIADAVNSITAEKVAAKSNS